MCCIQRGKRKAKEKERTECTKTRKNKINKWRKKNLEKDEGEEDFYKVKRERERKEDRNAKDKKILSSNNQRTKSSIHSQKYFCDLFSCLIFSLKLLLVQLS